MQLAQPSYPSNLAMIQRAVALTLNPQARAVAQRALGLSQRWLAPVTPPLQIVDADDSAWSTSVPASVLPPTNGLFSTADNVPSTLQALLLACETLADQEVIQRLHTQGYTPAQANTIQLWLIVDLTPASTVGSAAVHQTAAAAAQTPVARLPATDVHSHAFVDLVTQSIQYVFRRLKVHLAVNLLLLAAPAEQDLAAAWAQALRPLCAERIFVAGPINYQYQWVRQWQASAATALCALLWGVRNEQPQPTAYPDHGQWVRTVGAAAWLSPQHQLQQWLTTAWLQERLTRLQQPSSAATLPLTCPTLEALNQALTTLVPPPANLPFQGPGYPSWATVARWPEQLTSEITRQLQHRLASQKRARLQWLADETTTWDHAIRALRIHYLQADLLDNQNWPSLVAYHQSLAQARQHLMAAAAQLDDQLEALGETLSQATQSAQAATVLLRTHCSSLPRLHALAWLQIVSQPWRWLAWLRTYFMVLPDVGQHLLDALLREHQLQWQQANLLCVRQLFLAMLQSINTLQAELNQVEQRVTAITQQLHQQGRQLMIESLTPWQPAQLQQWAQRTTAESAYASLAPQPLEHWPTLATDRLFEQLLSWAHTVWPELGTWSALETLGAAFPTTAGLLGWFEQFLSQAAPLWPAQELLPVSRGETWLFAPQVAAVTAMASDEPAVTAHQTAASTAIRTLALAQPDLQWGDSAVNGLLALRWVLVDLAAAV